jgi:predicted nuclease with TOPRIM domain
MEKDQLIKELTLLERKIKLFMSEHQSAQEELKILKVENNNLKTTLKRKEQQIGDFQNQNKISTIVDSVATGGENATELKQYINEYIKEIDKCIAQLSA